MKRFLLIAAAVAIVVLAATKYLGACSTEAVDAATADSLPPLREQAVEQQRWLEARVFDVLPGLMRKHGVDLWVLSMREYAEDPVFWAIASPTTFAARRRSIYLFIRRDDGTVRNVALGGSSQGDVFDTFSNPDPGVAGAELWAGGQWRLFRRLVEEIEPKTIVLNIDPVHAFADGLHSGEREELERALGPELTGRVKRVPELSLDFIATRVPAMNARYRKLQETVHAVISEAFSSAVITPGVTSTEDVVWWLREKVRQLGMTTWFQPSVAVHRPGETPDEDTVIQHGDMLWCDFGVVAMRLATDTQHLGYVLRKGEKAAPEGLQRGLRTSNRLQDILLAEMIPGRTGNEVLDSALTRMRRENIDGTIYTHPIGDHGHGAGPLIGLWDRQGPIAGRGEVRLIPNTWHSIELQATVPVDEWGGQAVSFRQEEEAAIDAEGNIDWVYPRQTQFHLVR